jgi:hypothetical protein
MLHFCTTFCSSAMASKSTGSTAVVVAIVSDGSGGEDGQDKNRQEHFQTRQIQHLHIEFGNESQMALLLQQNGGRKCAAKQS